MYLFCFNFAFFLRSDTVCPYLSFRIIPKLSYMHGILLFPCIVKDLFWGIFGHFVEIEAEMWVDVWAQSVIFQYQNFVTEKSIIHSLEMYMEIMVSKWYHLGSGVHWWQFWIFFPPSQLCFTFLVLWTLFWFHWKYMLSSKQILSLNKGLKYKYIPHLRMGQVWCPETSI